MIQHYQNDANSKDKATLLEKIKRFSTSLNQHALQGYHKIKAFIPIYGFVGTLKIVIKNIIWAEVMYRLEKSVSDEEQAVTCKLPLTISIYSSRDEVGQIKGGQEIIKIRGEYGVEQFKTRFARGDLCFAAYAGDQFVGYLWVEFPPVSEAGYKLAADECYQFDGWVFEKYRGNRVLPCIVQDIMRYMRENRRDIKTIVSHVAVWNKPSLIVGQKMGFTKKRLEMSLILLGYHRKLLLKRWDT